MNRTKQWCVLGFCILLLPGTVASRAWAVEVRSDFDGDCDVDAADLAHLQSCALGPSVPQPDPACVNARLDADQDVDLDDFGIFQRCYSGAGLAADPNCEGTCVGPGCNCLCGQTDCNGTCTWLSSDSANCGTCGHACTTGRCESGACVPCPVGTTLCSGVCVYLPEDPQNCGSCGNVCPAGTSCMGGFCQPNDGGGCSGTCLGLCSGQCVNLCSDGANCGTCGNVCPAGTTCIGGTCTTAPCAEGLIRCNGVCTDPSSDPNNCRGCGIVCPPDMICTPDGCVGGGFFTSAAHIRTASSSNAVCSPPCLAGLTLCNDGCRELSGDSGNCGACGNVCPFGSGCLDGQCFETGD